MSIGNPEILEIAQDLSLNDMIALISYFSDKIIIHDSTDGATMMHGLEMDLEGPVCSNGCMIQINICKDNDGK